MSKFIRTSKGYINSHFIARIEIADASNALIYFTGPGSDFAAEVKGEEEVRELKALLALPVPKEPGYTGDAMHEYPEGRKTKK